MTLQREDPELETILQRERDGSGRFDAISYAWIDHEIDHFSPKPGPNYYAFNEDRIRAENTVAQAWVKKLTQIKEGLV